MAYTATLLKQSIMGNERVAIYSVAADAASGKVATSFGYIDAAILTPISMTTSCPRVKVNLNDTSAVCNGVVFLSSMTNTDVFFLTVYGRS